MGCAAAIFMGRLHAVLVACWELLLSMGFLIAPAAADWIMGRVWLASCCLDVALLHAGSCCLMEWAVIYVAHCCAGWIQKCMGCSFTCRLAVAYGQICADYFNSQGEHVHGIM
ncbi:hypothetical protein Dimus_012982 [Dionaea muscipula]